MLIHGTSQAPYMMIDIFLIVKLNSLVITMGFHTYLAYVVSQVKNEPLNLLINSKLVQKVRPKTGTEDENIMDYEGLKYAQHLNTIMKVIFPLFMIVFNGIFFTVALMEYFRPADLYILGNGM